MENIMDRVLYEKRGRVGIISLNMVGDNNRCDIHSYPAINEALLRVRDDDDVWAVVMQSAPGKTDFCVGADLSSIENFMDATKQGLGTYLENDMTTPKPIICAVHGWTIGEGFSFMLGCDIVIADPNTKFWMNESQRGLNPVTMQVKLTQKIGYNRAMGFMIPGDPETVAWGDKVGLVNKIITPGEDVRQVAFEYAKRITEICAPIAVHGTKAGAWETVNGHLDEAITKALWAKDLCIDSKDLEEALIAWQEGRPAVFKNE